MFAQTKSKFMKAYLNRGRVFADFDHAVLHNDSMDIQEIEVKNTKHVIETVVDFLDLSQYSGELFIHPVNIDEHGEIMDALFQYSQKFTFHSDGENVTNIQFESNNLKEKEMDLEWLQEEIQKRNAGMFDYSNDDFMSEPEYLRD